MTLGRVARRQGGAFTRRQAARLGVPPEEATRRVLCGQWLEPLPGVLHAATTPVTPALQAWAGVLAAGPPVALAGRFAAELLGLERAPRAVQPEFVIPMRRMRRELPGIRVTRTRIDWPVLSRRGLPFPPVAVVIRQVAIDAPDPVIRDVVQHALRRREVTLEQLLGQLGRGRPGAARLRRVLEEVAPGYQVVWERRLHRAVLAEGVRLRPQVPVRAPDGRAAVIDLGDEQIKFGVEIDGFLNHMARFAADRRRARMLGDELGWTIAPYAVEELARDLRGVAREIADSVRRRRRELPAA
jgi:very-short-patch-repair endonuclease